MNRDLSLTDLSDTRERMFVAAVFELGGPQHAAEAALRAGYAATPGEAERAAAFLLGAARIRRAIAGETKARFDVAALAAFATLVEVCGSKSAPASARITAATEILNRSSIGPILSRSVNLNAEIGVEALLEKLDAGVYADIIDAVAARAEDAPATAAEAL